MSQYKTQVQESRKSACLEASTVDHRSVGRRRDAQRVTSAVENEPDEVAFRGFPTDEQRWNRGNQREVDGEPNDCLSSKADR